MESSELFPFALLSFSLDEIEAEQIPHHITALVQN